MPSPLTHIPRGVHVAVRIAGRRYYTAPTRISGLKTARHPVLATSAAHPLRSLHSSLPLRIPSTSPVAAAVDSGLDTQDGPIASTSAFPSAAQAQLVPETLTRRVLTRTYELLESDIGGEEVWGRRLKFALSDLSTPRNIRIGVLGTPHSQATHLVSSLILDPLSENPAAQAAILARHEEGLGETFVLRWGAGMRRDVGVLEVESGWLDSGVEVVEILTESPESALSELLKTDIPLLVIDPITLLSSPTLTPLLPHLLTKPNLRIIINGPLPTPAPSSPGTAESLVLQRLSKQLKTLYKSLDLPHSTPLLPISITSSAPALQALHALSSAMQSHASPTQSARVAAFQEFQDGWLASGVGAVKDALGAEGLRLGQRGRETREETAEFVAERVLGYIDSTISKLTDDAERALSLGRHLTASSSSTISHLRDHSFATKENVQEQLRKTRLTLQDVWKGRMGWWKVFLGRVDRVGEEIGGEVQARWGGELSSQLSFEAGRIQAAQKVLSDQIDEFLKTLSPLPTDPPQASHPFHSPILLNKLSQLSFTSAINPSTFLPPLQRRRDQLVNHVVPEITTRAHRILWTSYSLIFLSASGSWSACVPLELCTGTTGFGIFLLFSLGVLRWAVGRWAGVQKKFWKDWDRVEQGLEWDVEQLWVEVMQDKVGMKTRAAVEGLEELVRKRKIRLEGVDEKLAEIRRIAAGGAEGV